MKYSPLTTVERRVLDLLVLPSIATELRETLGISKQRLQVLLKSLIRKGLVTRVGVTYERGRHLYFKTKDARRHHWPERLPVLTQARGLALSALPHDTVCGVSQTAKLLGMQPSPLRQWFAHFESQGLVRIFKLGRHHYVVLTPEALKHPQYDPKAPKAPPSDAIEEFGSARAKLIQDLFKLEQMRMTDIARYIKDDAIPYRPGTAIQRLSASDYVERVPDTGKAILFRLSPKGRVAAAVIAKLRPG